MTEATIKKVLSDPDAIIQLATTLKEEQEKRRLLEAQNEALKTELDESQEWYSIKRVANLNNISWRSLDWKKLKAAGERHGFHPKKVFDPNFGQVNVYHRTVWEEAYPQYEL